MTRTRMEAFSDGVIAIIITIMVLELKVPHGAEWSDLGNAWPVFASYLLSFVYVAIYWNNHHHLLHTVERVTGGILWGNLHLLFWLSLTPFITAWMAENHFARVPVALYGAVLFLTAMAWQVLQWAIMRAHGAHSKLKRAVGADLKGKLSGAFYLAGIPLAYIHTGISLALYVAVALMWLVPDRRIEGALRD